MKPDEAYGAPQVINLFLLPWLDFPTTVEAQYVSRMRIKGKRIVTSFGLIKGDEYDFKSGNTRQKKKKRGGEKGETKYRWRLNDKDYQGRLS